MSLYEVLKASKAQRFPDYWTQLWGRKLSESMIKTLTGTLPLTFTAKAGNLLDWAIYGNDDIGENLFGFVANDFIASEIIAGAAKGCVLTGLIPNENYTMTTNASRQTIGANIWFGGDSTENDGVWNGQPRTKSADSNGQIIIYMRTSEIENLFGNCWFMVTKGSTAPDHYIPYQQGVGKRTANIIDVEKYVAGVRTVNYGISEIVLSANEIAITPNTNFGSWYVGTARKRGDGNVPSSEGTQRMKIEAEGEQTYTLNFTSSSTLSQCYLTFTNENFETLNENYILFSSARLPLTFTTPQGTKYIFLRFGDGNVNLDFIITNVMIVQGSTVPTTYIPYGYEIPISVNNTPQTFYIGDSPLTAGQSISKTSTGVDLELSDGENTISTALYNKPKVEIKYK